LGHKKLSNAVLKKYTTINTFIKIVYINNSSGLKNAPIRNISNLDINEVSINMNAKFFATRDILTISNLERKTTDFILLLYLKIR
jgi:hypothetical protein